MGLPIRIAEKIFKDFGWNDRENFPLDKVLQNWGYRSAYAILLQPLSMFDKEGYNFLEDEWDYAIVLDACRYDITKDLEVAGQKFEKRISPASATMEWISRCITEPRDDIVLVNANPYLSKIKLEQITGMKEPFHLNVPMWDTGWSEEFRITPPWKMLPTCKKITKMYPDKKIIFWFMQPHHPFIGFSSDDIWSNLRKKNITLEESWSAYKNNLNIALKFAVNELVDFLSGDIIITSDHGNCFGELGLFAHPQRIHIKSLVEVPFMRVKK